MSQIFPVTNMQVSENTALLIKENTTLYIDALNENAVITLPNASENPNLFLNIINTSILHQLVILDVITLNPNNGVSLKCDGEKWIYEQLNSESLYMLSLSNGIVGSEVHNLTQIFNSTNNFNNLSENYRSFLTISPDTSAEIKLDYDNKITNDITSSLTQDNNYDIYTYTSTADGLITINLRSNLNGGLFYIIESDTNYAYYCSPGRNGRNTCSFIIGKNRSLIIKNDKNASTNCTITEIPFKKLSISNNNSSEESSPTSFEFDVTYPLLDFENGISLEYLSKSTFVSKPYYVYYTMPFDGMIHLSIQAGSNNSMSGWGAIQITRNSKTYAIDSIKCTNGVNYINCYAKKDDEVLFMYNYADGSVTNCRAYPFLKETITSDTLNTSTSSKVTYSTQEEIQIGTWEDGRPVYRKIFRGDGPTSNSASLIVPGSEQLANVVDIVLRLDGTYYWSSTRNNLPINFPRSSTEYSQIYYTSTAGIYLNLTISNWYNSKYTIVFEYVKK